MIFSVELKSHSPLCHQKIPASTIPWKICADCLSLALFRRHSRVPDIDLKVKGRGRSIIILTTFCHVYIVKNLPRFGKAYHINDGHKALVVVCDANDRNCVWNWFDSQKVVWSVAWLLTSPISIHLISHKVFPNHISFIEIRYLSNALLIFVTWLSNKFDW